MTKQEFLKIVPKVIKHVKNGYADLEIIYDNKDKKGICYRYEDKTTACGNYASSWLEVYNKLSKCLDDDVYKAY
jgi:hypothetical protein